MTPQSGGRAGFEAGVGQATLGGTHWRCAANKLGHQFERRELDEVYRRFVVIADRIKKVQDKPFAGADSRRDQRQRRGARNFRPRQLRGPFPRAAAAGAGCQPPRTLHPAQVSGIAGQAKMTIPFSDHHSEAGRLSLGGLGGEYRP